MDCDSLLTKEEKVCLECGKVIAVEKFQVADLFVTVLSILFYVSLAALAAAIFLPGGPSVVIALLTTCALQFMLRSAKDGSKKVGR